MSQGLPVPLARVSISKDNLGSDRLGPADQVPFWNSSVEPFGAFSVLTPPATRTATSIQVKTISLSRVSNWQLTVEKGYHSDEKPAFLDFWNARWAVSNTIPFLVIPDKIWTHKPLI